MKERCGGSFDKMEKYPEIQQMRSKMREGDDTNEFKIRPLKGLSHPSGNLQMQRFQEDRRERIHSIRKRENQDGRLDLIGVVGEITVVV